MSYRYDEMAYPYDQEPDLAAEYVAPVLSFGGWADNAELIADCARLGYLRKDWRTLDTTYGMGSFWKLWEPDVLVGCDLDPDKSPVGIPVDFTDLPFIDRSFDAVVFDPPYKLGTPETAYVNKTKHAFDSLYGVDKVALRWQDRMDLIRSGLAECARVLGDGYLLVKCQDQVCSGKIRWQTDAVTVWARGLGLGKVDRFDFKSYRPQPKGRRQVHAARNTSQLLVFKRGWGLKDYPPQFNGEINDGA